jgi:hypothetical protein
MRTLLLFRSRRGRWGTLSRLAIVFAAVMAGWLTLVVHPQPLFAYSATRTNVVLHARSPLGSLAGPLLDDVVGRLSRSPLYDSHRVHHVFLCDTPTLFAFFNPMSHNAGGVTQVQFGGNVFIRPSNLQRGTVIGPSGREKTGERTLAYFIAHEVTHAMTADRIGRRNYFRLRAFQVEGYADYVGMSRPLDFVAERDALAHEDPEMSPRVSGLYKRYELLVAYLLEKKGMSVEDLLSRPLEQHALEREVLSATFESRERH